MKFKYKTELFENFENPTLTEAFLNKYGEDGFKLRRSIMLGFSTDGSIKGICIFEKELEEN